MNKQYLIKKIQTHFEKMSYKMRYLKTAMEKVAATRKVNRYFAELNTDRIIRETYFPDFNYKGTMIEVGGGTPSFLSMSKHFKMNGWRTIIIEPNPKYVELHKQCGNEIYEYACSNEDKDNADFQVVHLSDDYEQNRVTDHSYSALAVKDDYLKRDNITINQLPVINIKVNVRKLNTILNEIGLTSFDFLSIDVEGWELDVLNGLDLNVYRPKVILLENYLYDPEYITFMSKFNYRLDKQIDYNYIFIQN
jgi:methyltransferase, FkbM family